MLRWNVFTTRDKIRVARALYRGVATLRKLTRQPRLVKAKRRGVVFELDPAEGIDLAMYLFGLFEADTYRAMQRLVRPGDTVLDIGANSGVHTLPLARMVGEKGRVVAFEPTTAAFGRLRRNLDLNADLEHRVTLINAYLNDGRDRVRTEAFYATWRLDSAENQHPKHFGSLSATEGSIGAPLDEFVERLGIDRIDLMKVDVDGYECKVFRGAETSLEKHRPKIVVELCPYALQEQGDSAQGLLELLAEKGYSFFDERTGQPLPANPEKIELSIKPDSSINLVALPDVIVGQASHPR